MTKDFSIGIVARLKHGDLLDALAERGWNQTQGAEFFGISNTTFGKLINMQWVPKRISKKFERKLFELTGKLPDELWPKEVFTQEFLDQPKAIKAVRRVPVHQLAGFGLLQLQASPDELFDQTELSNLLADSLSTLNPRQEKVIRARYLEDKTLEEVAAELGVSRGRVGQVEAKALRKLRHPKHTRRLRPFV